jgi:hypothetical protein
MGIGNGLKIGMLVDFEVKYPRFQPNTTGEFFLPG